ncbi:MAG: Mur ligase family protein [Acidimicrobiales bacterium]
MTPGAITGALAAGWLQRGAAWITVAACVAACVPAGLRWLRVAQREHYLGGSCGRFALRWWTVTPLNSILALVGVGAGLLAVWWPLAGVGTAAVIASGPVGLSTRGRTSPLAWTRRLRTLAGLWAILEIAVVAAGAVTGPASPMAAAAAIGVPLLVDVACVLTAPLERRLSEHFVTAAGERLGRVAPTVVAVTGSYGKTSTKNHIVHLVQPNRSIVATPASFNNRAGLARAINEHLADGTEVFVAEMGTYGPGEIADMCRWCPPQIAVITAIGPVHLERFGSEDRIVQAKSEIAVHAADVVIQVDDPRLAAVADRLAKEGKRVIRCSAIDRSADVRVAREAGPTHDAGANREAVVIREAVATVSVVLDGETVATGIGLPTGVQPANLACAVGAALSVGVTPASIIAAVGDLPPVDHRLQAVRSQSGVAILDDTYNSNPAGARAALATLVRLAAGEASDGVTGLPPVTAVVTPGMVELGSAQTAENHRFGAEIAASVDYLVVVGRTNRRALLRGAASVPSARAAGCVVRCVADRPEAVAWVREHLGPRDAVLYENDLPDHYP